MRCDSCGSDRIRKASDVFEERLALADANAARDRQTVEALARVAPPRLRNVDKAIGCIAAFGVVGVGWHVFWIGAGIFFLLAVNDASWNNSVWPGLYAAWKERYACEQCGAVRPAAVCAAADGEDDAARVASGDAGA